MEVAEAMSRHLALGFSNLRQSEFGSISNRVFDALYAGDPEEVLEGMKCFFENGAWDNDRLTVRAPQHLFDTMALRPGRKNG